MSNEIAKQVATNELTRRGFKVEPIDRGEGKTADLLVTGQKSNYLIEAKDRLVDPAVNERRQEHFAAGKMFINSDPVTFDNNICTALREAQKQLNDTPQEPGTFRLIWIHAVGLDADHKYRRVIKTLYGHAWLCPVDSDQSVHCLYFHFNVAYDLRDVEAVIISNKNGMEVCLNGLADRINEFRESELCQTYKQLHRIFDPMAKVGSGDYIACTASISRKDPDAVLKAIESDTGIRYRKLPDLLHHTFEIGPHGAEYPDEISC